MGLLVNHLPPTFRRLAASAVRPVPGSREGVLGYVCPAPSASVCLHRSAQVLVEEFDHDVPCIPVLGNIGISFGLGEGAMNYAAKAGMMSSEGTFFWHGAAATTFWIDPAKNLVVVAMTQHMGSEKSDLSALIPEVRTLVYSALME